jgi:hypothetical protein
MAESDDLERGIFPDPDEIPDQDAAEDQGNLMGDDEDPDYSGNPPSDEDTELSDLVSTEDGYIRRRDK